MAANDSHHNLHVRAVLNDDGLVKIEDAIGTQVALVDPEKTAIVKGLIKGKRPGDLVLEMDLDPYERSFRHVSTHLLMNELTEPAVVDALKSGRAYVAFDWLADPTGFVFEAVNGEQHWPVGSEPRMTEGLRLRGAAPLRLHPADAQWPRG